MQGDTGGIGGEGEKVRQLRDTDRGEEEEEAGESPSIIQEANEQSRAKGAEGDGKVDWVEGRGRGGKMLQKVRFGEIGDGCNSRANAEKIAAAPPSHCRSSREIVSKFTDAPKCATTFHSHLSRQICYLLCRGGRRRRGGPVVVSAAGRHRLIVLVAHAGVHGGTAASATSLALPRAILLGFLFPMKGISFCSTWI